MNFSKMKDFRVVAHGSGDFQSLMTIADANAFNVAFGINSSRKSYGQRLSRSYVENVFLVFEEKIGITHAQAVHAFKSGHMRPILRTSKVIPKEVDEVNAMALVRKAWEFALNTSFNPIPEDERRFDMPQTKGYNFHPDLPPELHRKIIREIEGGH